MRLRSRSRRRQSASDTPHESFLGAAALRCVESRCDRRTATAKMAVPERERKGGMGTPPFAWRARRHSGRFLFPRPAAASG